MNRRIQLGLAALALGILSLPVKAKTDAHYFRFVGIQEGEFVLQPMVAPMLGVRQTAGEPLQERDLINCSWRTEIQTTVHGDKIPVLNGYCENGVKLALTAIDLNH